MPLFLTDLEKIKTYFSTSSTTKSVKDTVSKELQKLIKKLAKAKVHRLDTEQELRVLDCFNQVSHLNGNKYYLVILALILSEPSEHDFIIHPLKSEKQTLSETDKKDRLKLDMALVEVLSLLKNNNLLTPALLDLFKQQSPFFRSITKNTAANKRQLTTRYKLVLDKYNITPETQEIEADYCLLIDILTAWNLDPNLASDVGFLGLARTARFCSILHQAHLVNDSNKQAVLAWIMQPDFTQLELLQKLNNLNCLNPKTFGLLMQEPQTLEEIFYILDYDRIEPYFIQYDCLEPDYIHTVFSDDEPIKAATVVRNFAEGQLSEQQIGEYTRHTGKSREEIAENKILPSLEFTCYIVAKSGVTGVSFNGNFKFSEAQAKALATIFLILFVEGLGNQELFNFIIAKRSDYTRLLKALSHLRQQGLLGAQTARLTVCQTTEALDSPATLPNALARSLVEGRNFDQNFLTGKPYFGLWIIRLANQGLLSDASLEALKQLVTLLTKHYRGVNRFNKEHGDFLISHYRFLLNPILVAAISAYFSNKTTFYTDHSFDELLHGFLQQHLLVYFHCTLFYGSNTKFIGAIYKLVGNSPDHNINQFNQKIDDLLSKTIINYCTQNAINPSSVVKTAAYSDFINTAWLDLRKGLMQKIDEQIKDTVFKGVAEQNSATFQLYIEQTFCAAATKWLLIQLLFVNNQQSRLERQMQRMPLSAFNNDLKAISTLNDPKLLMYLPNFDKCLAVLEDNYLLNNLLCKDKPVFLHLTKRLLTSVFLRVNQQPTHRQIIEIKDDAPSSKMEVDDEGAATPLNEKRGRDEERDPNTRPTKSPRTGFFEGREPTPPKESTSPENTNQGPK